MFIEMVNFEPFLYSLFQEGRGSVVAFIMGTAKMLIAVPVPASKPDAKTQTARSLNFIVEQSAVYKLRTAKTRIKLWLNCD